MDAFLRHPHNSLDYRDFDNDGGYLRKKEKKEKNIE